MSNTKNPNYRIYDRTGGGVTHDIYAETLDDAIEQGREWIEDGDWSAEKAGTRYQVELPLECEVGEITYEPNLSSIHALPAVGDVSMEDGVIIAEIDQERVDYVAIALGARLVRVDEPEENGYARYAVCLAGPVPTMPVYSEERHDCSGEYSDPLPECAQSERAGDDDETDDEGHVWRQPHSVVGGCRENPGYWSAGGTATRSLSVCRLCGCYRDETDAGCQRNSGEPRGTITIRDRDEDSEAWLKRTHKEDGFIPEWLAEMLDCSVSRMDEEKAREYVATHSDEDTLDEDDLEHAFSAIFGRRPDDRERAEGLWSHLCDARGKGYPSRAAAMRAARESFDLARQEVTA